MCEKEEQLGQRKSRIERRALNGRGLLLRLVLSSKLSIGGVDEIGLRLVGDVLEGSSHGLGGGKRKGGRGGVSVVLDSERYSEEVWKEEEIPSLPRGG